MEWGREMSPRFPFATSEVWKLPRARWHNLVCVCVCVCVCVRVCSQWWLVFALLGVDATLGVRFEITHIVSGKWNVSKVIPRLYGRVYKTLRLSPLVNEHSVVVWLQVPNQDNPRLNPMVSQFSIPVLSDLCSESAEA